MSKKINTTKAGFLKSKKIDNIARPTRERERDTKGKFKYINIEKADVRYNKELLKL